MSSPRHRSGPLLLGSAISLLAIALATVWWTLPVVAPGFVLRHFPPSTPCERAIVRLAEIACDTKESFTMPMDAASFPHPSAGAAFAHGLRHERAEVRLAIIDGVRSRNMIAPVPSIIPRDALIMALEDAEPEVRTGIMSILRQALPRYPALTAAQLHDVATDPDDEVRQYVAQYARDMKIPETALLMLDDADAYVRRVAIGGLDLPGDPTRAEKLVRLLSDPEPGVCVAASKALGDFGDEGALPALIGNLTHSDARVREALVEALGKIEDIRALPAVIAVLDDQAIPVRRAAANALGMIADPRAISALATCSRKDPDRTVRCAAVSSLEAIKDPGTLDPLMQALKDPDPVVRAMAEAVIGRRP